MTVLTVSGVAVELAGRQVLHDVDLSIAASEHVGLIGPNGAGKTTLLRALLALLPVTAGTITINGSTPSAARGSIGYVPQRHEFVWDYPVQVRTAVMTGRTHRIGWLRRPGQTDRDAVQEALERVDLADLANRPIGELSGGQRQRVLVARALALRPQLLLLDEPFTGLDVPTQEILTRLFKDLTAEGTAILMTTHDLPAAADTCHRLCLLNGTVVADGPPEELRDPAVWLRAFGVARSEQLLHSLGVTR
ncbi:anchored repeat-type ABC transporter ATP-binding subunit [Kribbella sandramycini]|uniref:Anchored repeat-type ABC transporter ATP-binding subunit n=1 Tax=Kribbella sandramycini TaxID=60450 RepID=A0A7Y4L4H3_9ACTN|nr:anchored repeat-type ABC transporter ATP-binding subunit [Kribbella sandramycini]MBB6571598.1 manganese/iron transport system ATP-binding protein [Kribbella sandramycini]NOL44244.1 anchored repeat-type ABC transporter ATP-binding subunit [Kribbella sandramycini]